MNILVFQNDEKTAQYIALSLKEAGYLVNYTNDFLEATCYIESVTYDLIILDSLELCKEIRNKNENSNIIFVSNKCSSEYKIKAYDMGTDDFIEKPLHMGEFLAKIRAIFKRKYLKNTNFTKEQLKIDDLILNYRTREVKRAGITIDLTNKEFFLLEYFMRNKNILLTRTMIKEQIWGIDFVSSTNIIDVYVKYLRDKIEKNYKKKLFHTVRGSGYILKD